MSRMLSGSAYAKVNLSLEVVGRRRDGYHDLVSVMQIVDLTDSLTIRSASRMELISSDNRMLDPSNLVLRAADLLRNRYTTHTDCLIRLEKGIPIAAGLGGGSSDASAALVLLSQFWCLELSCSEFEELSAELGSDVPFFLQGGTALVEGRGEVVMKLPEPKPAWYVIVNPGFGVPTARVFDAVDRDEWSDGSASYAVAKQIEVGGEVVLGVNSLQDALFRVAPRAKQCFEDVRSLAPGKTLVSGSGPTVIARFSIAEEARTLERQLASSGYWIRVARSVTIPGAPCQ